MYAYYESSTHEFECLSVLTAVRKEHIWICTTDSLNEAFIIIVSLSIKQQFSYKFQETEAKTHWLKFWTGCL